MEDAERDTRVSRRYLQALETEDFSIFPAPVYARGFLRTYARYLGLNPDELIQDFSSSNLAPDVNFEPLPTVSRPAAPLINVNWVVTGLVAVFLVGAALLLLQGGEDPARTTGSNGSNVAADGPGSVAGSQVQGVTTSVDAPAQGKQIGPIRPGELPDFVGADLASSLAVLRDNEISYVIVEFADRTTAQGIVVNQSPSGGSKSNDDATITLYVSAGGE